MIPFPRNFGCTRTRKQAKRYIFLSMRVEKGYAWKRKQILNRNVWKFDRGCLQSLSLYIYM